MGGAKAIPILRATFQRHDVRRTVGRISDSVIRHPTGNMVALSLIPLRPERFVIAHPEDVHRELEIIGLTSVDDYHFSRNLSYVKASDAGRRVSSVVQGGEIIFYD